MPAKKPLDERVLSRVEKTDGCWMWPGSTTKNGYGTASYRVDGVQRIALTHRVVYEALVGPIPEGLDLDHLCRVRLCCNPDHLEPVTRRENVHRGAGYRPSHCKHGHAYDEENSHYTKRGHIKCRACNRQRLRERRINGKDSARATAA